MNDPYKKQFVWGALLAWAPWVPTIIGLRYAFRGISNTKATGLAAIVGGLGESFALWGVVSMIVSQVVALVWLGKAFSSGHWFRNLFSVFSIVLSGLMLVLVCLFVAGMVWFLRHR